MPDQALERLLSAAESARELGLERRAHELFDLARTLKEGEELDPRARDTGVWPKAQDGRLDAATREIDARLEDSSDELDEIHVTFGDTFDGEGALPQSPPAAPETPAGEDDRASQPPILLVRPRPRDEADTDLPPWMPSDRVLGSFFIHRGLGSGAFSSVFVATRKEDVGVADADHFAIKLPDYDAMGAQGVDETSAEQLFREEAAALLTLPAHPNLARLVGFDQTSATKPFLVMELVRGPSCEKLLDDGEMDEARAREILDGVLEALSVMHAAGIGHLDLKPANVVLRDGAATVAAQGQPRDVPVLVDFGLAGRRIRPGYATAEYAAPEVWNHDVSSRAAPTLADIYSFGCLAYEMLTGAMLFQADDLTTLMAMHAAHDGRPRAIRELAESGRTDLARLIESCLRHEPTARASLPEIRQALRKLPRPGG